MVIHISDIVSVPQYGLAKNLCSSSIEWATPSEIFSFLGSRKSFMVYFLCSFW